MIYSKKVREDERDKIRKWLPIRVENNIGSYLGLPTSLGRSRRVDFNYLMDRIKRNMNRWKEKQLSYVGKVILLKAFAQLYLLMI